MKNLWYQEKYKKFIVLDEVVLIKLPSKSTKYAVVDTDVFFKKELYQFTWYSININKQVYARTNINNRIVYLHRIIMDPKDGMNVDHINNDALDNRIENLRICTPAQNQYNKTRDPGKYSKYKGVSVVNNKYMARIYYKRKSHILGYGTEKECALMYNEAAKELFGEFAKLNIIDTLN
jgi:hypothetical protein